MVNSPSIEVDVRRCGVTFSDAMACSVAIPSFWRKVSRFGEDVLIVPSMSFYVGASIKFWIGEMNENEPLAVPPKLGSVGSVSLGRTFTGREMVWRLARVRSSEVV